MRPSLKKHQFQCDKMIDQEQQMSEVSLQKPVGNIKKDRLVRKCNNDITQSYIFLKKLGQGSFGEVFLVMHKLLKVKRALKIIQKSEKPHSNAADQLQILKRLDHPNILKIYEYFETQNKWYIITEYFEGIQLFQKIVNNDRLSQQITARIVLQIIKALAYIHNNKIAHRDIKAQNILIAQKDGQYVVKVIDWGLGAFTFGNHLNRKCGTPEYCAPEVLKGSYSIQCDMWSLGVLIHIMLSGFMPFKGKNMNETIKKVKYKPIVFTDPVWSDISMLGKLFVAGLLQRNPQKRLKAKDCLNHKWIIEFSACMKQEKKESNLSQTLKRIKDFSTQTRFQVVVINYILNFIQTPKHLQKLKRQFQILDLNGDGEINFEELRFAYRKIYGPEADLIAEEIFSSIDLDSSGKITFSQFVTVASEITHNFTNQKLKEAFKLFDTDNDGLIDQKQISQLIQYQKGSRSSQDLDDVVSEIDLNNDGKIDLSQFILHINKAVERVKTKTRSSLGCESTKKNESKQNQIQNKINHNSNQIKQTYFTAEEPQSQISDSTFQ